MDLDLAGRVALVTGGSQGIGREIALVLAAEGADVGICARRADRLQQVAAEIAALGRRVVAVPADVTTVDGPATVIAAVTESLGGVDILVNNAGKGHSRFIAELSDDDWHASLELNLMSAVRFSRECVPGMCDQGWGRIVNIASRVGREPDPYFAAYAAAKSALINFSKSLANAYSGDGVLTNCIVPGLIRGEAVEEAAQRSAAATGKTVQEVYAATLRKRPIPVGRMGEPRDVAGLAAFLASDHAAWITGACFDVDGGIVRTDR
ncbi:MAG: SDR family NAD(P)-dependent oxidoreductase [Actinobacteria bacterium]|nr:SDR family NAD(P)-dependent oxidoreductase [Actinomycetota bacterium]